MVGEWLPLVFTAGWASGINAYAVVLLLSVLGRFASVDAVPEALTSWPVLVTAAVLFLVEAVADKVPYLDSGWDAVHTVVRPGVGTALGLLMTGDAETWQQAIAAGLGGGTALASHLAKAGLRLAVNTSPEPFSNVAVSAGEDLAVGAVVSLAMVAPVVAAVIAGVLLVLAWVAVVLAWRLVRRGWRSWQRRRSPAPAG